MLFCPKYKDGLGHYLPCSSCERGHAGICASNGQPMLASSIQQRTVILPGGVSITFDASKPQIPKPKNHLEWEAIYNRVVNTYRQAPKESKSVLREQAIAELHHIGLTVGEAMYALDRKPK